MSVCLVWHILSKLRWRWSIPSHMHRMVLEHWPMEILIRAEGAGRWQLWLLVFPAYVYSTHTPFLRPFSKWTRLDVTRMSLFWILLELRMMEVMVTTGPIRHAKLQSKCNHNKPTTQFFYRQDALPVAQPTVSKHWIDYPYIALIDEIINGCRQQQDLGPLREQYPWLKVLSYW